VFTVDTTFVYQFISAPTLNELAQYPLCFTGFTGFSVPTFNGVTPSNTPTRFGTVHNIEPRPDCENPVQTINNHSNTDVDIATACSNNRSENVQITQISTTPVVQAGSLSVSGSFGNFSEENNVCGYSVESNQVTEYETSTVGDQETN
jgi:hypothetical protein